MAGRSRGSQAIRAVWILGYLIGTTSHIVDLALGGLGVYGEFPLGVRLFWVSLTILDPLVVVLLLLHRRTGVVLGAAIILVDIAVNWTVFASVGGLSPFGSISQTMFAVFVVATARPLWRSLNGDVREES
ncbi:hypothetical protein [Microbacterium murale]|uniref:Uncharacterized protein n=1 Tax=Microbacterium murale TaxID=1081040 RepID=A0ABU0PE66_9MICO|nr:hypothetical protein [Microbacterium murale]MDQ0644934.1 hypothetical protein [Microbacterium murale]